MIFSYLEEAPVRMSGSACHEEEPWIQRANQSAQQRVHVVEIVGRKISVQLSIRTV